MYYIIAVYYSHMDMDFDTIISGWWHILPNGMWNFFTALTAKMHLQINKQNLE